MVSNEKASVTKEQNDKHRKVLEGLMKLPDNKECADCRSKGPRWASVNLGVFVCIQCSGIHRSLGVHISKVRSATLDTWLPEQVQFMQSMGNVKANQYWESDMPSNFSRPKETDRIGLETFIRNKYEAKRWVPRGSGSPSSGERRASREDRRSSRDGPFRRISVEDDSYRYGSPGRESGDRYDRRTDTGNRERSHDFESNGLESREGSWPSNQNGGASSSRTTQPSSSGSRAAAISASAANRTLQDGASPARSREPSVTVPSLKSPPPPSVPVSSTIASTPAAPPNVEAETNLFDLLNIEDNNSGGAGTNSLPSDDDSWANFQSAETPVPVTPADESVKSTGGSVAASGSGQVAGSSSSSTVKNSVTAGLEDLFRGSPDVTAKSEVQLQSSSQAQKLQAEPRKDVRQSILSLFESSSMMSPYTAQQQQMATVIAQQQSMFMAAAAAAAASGVQGSYHQGQPAQNASKDENGVPTMNNAAVGQVWPMRVPGMMVNPLAYSNGGFGAPQGTTFAQATSTNTSQGPSSVSSLYTTPAAAVPFTSSYGPQGQSKLFGNGSQSTAVGVSSSPGSAFSSHPPSSQSLNPSSGASYDFSSLTANAFSKS